MCYSNSLHVGQLVSKNTSRFHHHANILEFLWNYLAKDWTVTIQHILWEGNSCADVLPKLGVDSSYHFITINEPPSCLSSALMGFLRCVLYKDLVFFFLSSYLFSFPFLFFSCNKKSTQTTKTGTNIKSCHLSSWSGQIINLMVDEIYVSKLQLWMTSMVDSLSWMCWAELIIRL